MPATEPHSATALTDWTMKRTGAYSRYKATTDIAERVQIDHQVGRFYFRQGLGHSDEPHAVP